ncbi:hypothetical protein Vi05172_g8935 [Venturia inaequalis]|nr:hypothetical protein Vi05172_g8935 [Venturia inaequalis]
MSPNCADELQDRSLEQNKRTKITSSLLDLDGDLLRGNKWLEYSGNQHYALTGMFDLRVTAWRPLSESETLT